MKIPKGLRSALRVCAMLCIATVLLMAGALLQATSPNPRAAVDNVVLFYQLLAATIILGGLGFLTEAE